jgi:hypothetical protein
MAVERVLLWDWDGTPLLWIEKSRETEGYRRRVMGFQPPESREKPHGPMGRYRDERPPEPEDDEEAIGEVIEVEASGEEEDESCLPTYQSLSTSNG